MAILRRTDEREKETQFWNAVSYWSTSRWCIPQHKFGFRHTSSSWILHAHFHFGCTFYRENSLIARRNPRWATSEPSNTTANVPVTSSRRKSSPRATCARRAAPRGSRAIRSRGRQPPTVRPSSGRSCSSTVWIAEDPGRRTSCA